MNSIDRRPGIQSTAPNNLHQTFRLEFVENLLNPANRQPGPAGDVGLPRAGESVGFRVAEQDQPDFHFGPGQFCYADVHEGIQHGEAFRAGATLGLGGRRRSGRLTGGGGREIPFAKERKWVLTAERPK